MSTGKVHSRCLEKAHKSVYSIHPGSNKMYTIMKNFGGLV